MPSAVSVAFFFSEGYDFVRGEPERPTERITHSALLFSVFTGGMRRCYPVPLGGEAFLLTAPAGKGRLALSLLYCTFSSHPIKAHWEFDHLMERAADYGILVA